MIAPGNRDRILVVDDDPGILRAVSRVFASRYEVATALGSAAALEIVARFRPALALVDIRMPEMNGFELMRHLRVAAPDIDVILMTGNAEEPDANLVQAIDAGAFYFIQKPFERQVLLALAGRCLELRRLREERQLYLRRLEKELHEAQQFQMSLLPPGEMEIRGLSICARHVACSALAGDFYDYVDAGDGAVAVVIADVVGHGASAAMMTGIVKAAFHASRAEGFAPLSVIERVKEGIRSFDAERFITLCATRLEIKGRKLEYVNAGHPPLIVHRAAGEPLLLDSTGPLISSGLADVEYEAPQVKLAGGDVLLFYTDGVVDAAGPAGRFGKDRMMSLLSEGTRRGPELLEGILSAVNEFSAGRDVEDDMTLLQAELPAKA